MKKKYSFGFRAEDANNAQVVNGFEVYAQNANNRVNNNPYNKTYFDRPGNNCYADNDSLITSIPSPYARMHVTDLAFYEISKGKSLLTQTNNDAGPIPLDYARALSHCLDMFELLFRSNEIDLAENGFSIIKLKLVLPNETEDEQIKKYLQTLELYREAYRRKIREKANNWNIRYFFDFNSLYVILHDNKPIVATSPYTGFFSVSEYNNFGTNIKLKDASGRERSVFSNDVKDIRDVKQRTKDFRIFMFLLLKDTGLQYMFENLFESVKSSFNKNELNVLNNRLFFDERDYQRFNIGTDDKLLKIQNKNVYLRPNSIDCSYLRYLLYLDNPAELNITKEEYNSLDEISERTFDNINLEWIGPNDILSDSLFVLPYDVNENYVALKYTDENDSKSYRRILLPIKSASLQYLPEILLKDNMKELANSISVRKNESGTFVVKMSIPLDNGGHTVIRREYVEISKREDLIKEKKDDSFGVIVNAADLEPFAFGIYPFIKAENNKNIYKVLHYNHFQDTNYEVKFFHDGYENGNIDLCPVIQEGRGEVLSNKTNIIGNGDAYNSMNSEYFHIEMSEPSVGIGFVEICYNNVENLIHSALIVPRLEPVENLHKKVTVAIDLGTSNTYMAYTVDGDVDVHDICTQHSDNKRKWNELTFLNKSYNRATDNRIIYDFSYDNAAEKNGFWLDSQLCEFIPSLIAKDNRVSEYGFPIPTVINRLRINGERSDNLIKDIPTKSLVHTSIPFAYYKRGVRYSEKYKSWKYYDKIDNGNNFKWFGGTKIDQNQKASFESFVEELLFIVRSHLLSYGYGLDNCTLLWSYPLSFSSDLVRDYKNVWKNCYKKYIADVDDNQLSEFVKYTNESRTPIYDCTYGDTANDQLVVLADIGGGSTDVIGYKHKTPLFMTSFGFAGNSLYLEGQHSSPKDYQETRALNYFWKIMDEKKDEFDSSTSTLLKYLLNTEKQVSPIMNYGFSESPDSMYDYVFRDEKVQFMLLFYSSALLFHIAQLCRIKCNDDRVPARLFFSGNGSKLLELIKDDYLKIIIQKTFKHVYQIEIIPNGSLSQVGGVKDKKLATARGGLLGLRKQGNEALQTNEQSQVNQVVLLGDKETYYDIDPHSDTIINEPNYIDKVKKNVDEFVDFFYSDICLKNEKKKLYSQETMKDALGQIVIEELDNNEIHDSIFFMYIARLLGEISETFCNS